MHRVSSPEAAELTKLLENIFRSVNIALVNELAQLCDRMGIDVWEVVDAAATKPFGFMSFQPGPGLGGHCIPIDPFYLTWKAREYDFYTEFIELAGKVNENMPYFCRSLISQALNHGTQKSLKGSRMLVLGVAYKADIGDMRESPALKLIELLQNAGAEVAYHDPHVPELEELGLRSVPLDPAAYDCVVIVTAHSSIDYDELVEDAELVVDLRNATRGNGDAQRQGLEAVKLGIAGLGYWGPNLARNFDDLAELAWLCDLSPGAAPALRVALSAGARQTADFDELLADPDARRRRGRDAGPDALRAGEARAPGRQARLRREAARDARRRDGGARRARRRARPRADAGPPAALPPGRAQAEGADRRRASSATCSASTATARTSGVIRKDENALWSLGVHDLSVILYLLDEEPSEVWAHGNAFLTPGVEDVVFCYLRFPSGRIAHMHLSWLDPHKMRKMTVVGHDKMAVFDDMELEHKVTIYDKAPVAAGGDVRRVDDAHRRQVQPEDRERRAAPARVPALPRRSSPATATRGEPRVDGLAVVRTLEQLTESLAAVPA